MAVNDDKQSGAPPREIHVEGKKDTNWLAWLALAAGLLALLLALSRCDTDDNVENVAVADETTAVAPVVQDTATPPLAGLGGYLGSTEALPRTFVFEKVNFDTAKSEIRDADRSELDALAESLKLYRNSRVRVIGYADARGDSAENTALGTARADSVKAALVASGIAATRIDTSSGGETDPVDSNQTSTGQAENRRTELEVLQR